MFVLADNLPGPISTTTIHTEIESIDISTPVNNSFFDRQQRFVSHALSNSVGWFDHFFTPKHEELEANQSFLRLIGTYQWINGHGFQFKPRFRLRVRVPGLQKRLSLIVSGEEENAELRSQDLTHASPVLDTTPANNRVKNKSVALHFMAYDWVTSRVDFDVGVRSGIDLEGTARYRRKMKLGELAQARFTETGFWRQKGGFGETTGFDIDRQVTPKTVLSWDCEGTYSEVSQGLDWYSSVGYEIRLSKKSALNFQALVVGVTRPHAVVNDYHFGPRYRQSIIRPWFFYEIEPGLDFKRKDEPGWESILSTAFRLEILYQNLPYLP